MRREVEHPDASGPGVGCPNGEMPPPLSTDPFCIASYVTWARHALLTLCNGSPEAWFSDLVERKVGTRTRNMREPSARRDRPFIAAID